MGSGRLKSEETTTFKLGLATKTRFLLCVVKPNVRTQPSCRSIFAKVAQGRKMQICIQTRDLEATENRKTMSFSAKMTETGFKPAGVAGGPTAKNFQLIYVRVETIAGWIRIAMLVMTQE